MGSWGVKALESDNGLDLIFLLRTEYLPHHKKLTLGGLIGLSLIHISKPPSKRR